MSKKRIVQAVILSRVVFLLAFVVVSRLLTLLRHGFSAHNNSSLIGTWKIANQGCRVSEFKMDHTTHQAHGHVDSRRGH